jgi:hypothetical protein
MKGYKNIINFLAKNNTDYFNISDEVPGWTIGRSEVACWHSKRSVSSSQLCHRHLQAGNIFCGQIT